MKFKNQLFLAGGVAAAQLFTHGCIPVALGNEAVAQLEFDNSMLWGTPADKASADLSRFSEGNPVPAGNLEVELYFNERPLKTTRIHFKAVSGQKSAVACFTPRDLVSLGLASDKLSKESALWLHSESGSADCKVVGDVVPGATASFDFSEQRLSLSIPQAFLSERPADYIDPTQWDYGINAGRLNYSLDVFDSTSQGRSDTQAYAYLESGLNVQGWRIRNISTVTSDRKTHDFQAQRTYAQTDIEPLKSTLTLGQNYTDGQLFNAYGLQGAFLATDMRMLPASLRNYAPVVTGSASSNAKVTIRQNNVVVYERAVPPGPFEINNLQTVGYGNDLEVTVTEADGSEKKFSVPYSPLVQLLRPGQSKYSASVGQAWSPNSGDYKPSVAQILYQEGLNNYVTAFGGAIVSEDYTALALGSAISTYIGGISADYTHSTSQSDSTGSATGDSVRFVYSTLVAPTRTNITLSSYRYSSREFWSFNEFVANENSEGRRGSNANYYYGAKQKGRFDISLRQPLAPGYGSFSLGGSTRTFWNRDGSDTQYQVSYANRYKDLTYDVSATRVLNQDNRPYNEFRLSFSVPIFASDTARNYLSASTWHNSETGSVAQMQLGGIAGADQQITYGVTTTQGLDHQNTQQTYGLNGAYQGSKGTATASVSHGRDYRQSSLGLSGSIVAHSEGVTFGQTLGDTVALVEAKDAQGARITNATGALLDGSGYGLVPYLAPYSRNRIEVDPEGLSTDLEFKDTSSEAVPVDGSIIKVKFQTSKENTLFINGTLEDGAPLPFGAEVVNVRTQNVVGYVGQAGGIFARGVDQQGQLQVRLKDSSCLMDYRVEHSEMPSRDAATGTINSINAVCRDK